MNPLQIKVSKPLDEQGAAYIRALAKVWGLTPTEISVLTGVARTTVRDVLHRRTWSHVPEGLVAWDGDHGRHPDAPTETGCCDQHPDQPEAWCYRGLGHRGSHLWVESWRTQSESTAWLALEMRAVIEEPAGAAQEPTLTPEEELQVNRERRAELRAPDPVDEPADAPPAYELVESDLTEEYARQLQSIRALEQLAERRQRIREIANHVKERDGELLDRLARGPSEAVTVHS